MCPGPYLGRVGRADRAGRLRPVPGRGPELRAPRLLLRAHDACPLLPEVLRDPGPEGDGEEHEHDHQVLMD